MLLKTVSCYVHADENMHVHTHVRIHAHTDPLLLKCFFFIPWTHVERQAGHTNRFYYCAISEAMEALIETCKTLGKKQ